METGLWVTGLGRVIHSFISLIMAYFNNGHGSFGDVGLTRVYRSTLWSYVLSVLYSRMRLLCCFTLLQQSCNFSARQHAERAICYRKPESTDLRRTPA